MRIFEHHLISRSFYTLFIMPQAIFFPIPIPHLTCLHQLDDTDEVLIDFLQFIDKHITLLILGNFEGSNLLFENAHQLCVQDGAHPSQRILWINDISQLATIRPKIEEILSSSFPERTIDFNNLRALSIVPETQEVTYLMYINPELSDNPKDKRKKLSTFQMQRAFNAAIKAIPNADQPTIT